MKNSTIVIFFLKIFGATLAFMVPVVLNRTNNTYELGKYALALTLVGVFVILTSAAQNVSLMRQFSSIEKHEKSDAVRKSIGISFYTYIALMPLFIYLMMEYYIEAIFYFSSLYLFNVLSQLKMPILLNEDRFFLNSLIDDFIRPLLGVIFALMIVFHAEINIFPFGLSYSQYLWSGIICLAAVVFLFFCTIKPAIGIKNSKLDINLFGDVKENYPVIVVALLNVLITQFDRFYISYFKGYEAAGLYFTAQSLVLVINYFNQTLILKNIINILKLQNKKSILSISNIVRKKTREAVVFNLFIIILFIILIPFIDYFLNLSGINFWGVVLILLFSQMISMCFGFGASIMLYGEKEEKMKLVYFSMISFIIGLIFGVSLIFVIGILGAAIGTGIGLIVLRLLPFLYFKEKNINLGLF